MLLSVRLRFNAASFALLYLPKIFLIKTQPPQKTKALDFRNFLCSMAQQARRYDAL